MFMKGIITAFLVLCMAVAPAAAQEFDAHFGGGTLRLDYVFCGDSQHQAIYFREAVKAGPWAGRRHNLGSPALRGDGQIRVLEVESGAVLYANSFASLFQEWQSTEEAKHLQKAFETCLLVPFPRHPVNVEVVLFDRHAKVSSRICHRVDPADILIRPVHQAEAVLLQPGPSLPEAVDIVIVSEGYGPQERDRFLADASRARDALFSHEPFTSARGRFSIRAVFVPSEDSGVSVPGKGAWKRTAVHSNFDTFYSSRYLTTSSIWALHEAIGDVPFEHIIVLANSEKYGGGGIFNSITLTTAHHPTFTQVLVHEFGHAFGGLADEYAYDEMADTVYPPDTEPWEQNITTKVDFKSKWQDLLGADVGLYQGAGNQTKGVWRPVPDCRMRTNQHPVFCPVCTRAISRIIDYYTESSQ